jgi:hypothetical protein
MYQNSIIYNAPSPNVGDCNEKGTWSSKKDEAHCKSCFKTAGESAGDYFYCEGMGCLSKYSSEVCNTGALVAKNIEQCSSPCVQQGDPTVGGGCSDKYDCNYKNGEICQKKQISINGGKQERGYCVPGGSQPPSQQQVPLEPPAGSNALMDLISNCSEDMNNVDVAKKCFASVNNLSCDDINSLILFLKNSSIKQGVYDEYKENISQIFTIQNEKLIIDVLNEINNSVNKVNCLIDSVNKNFELKNPKINTDNIKKQVVKNIYSNGTRDLQGNLSNIFSDTSQEFKTISMIAIAILLLAVCVLLYLRYTKQ